MNEKQTQVEVNGRKFLIKKVGALTGSYMATRVAKMLAPLVKSIDLDKLKEVKDPSQVSLKSFNFEGILSAIGEIEEKDFMYIQDKCLRVCSELLPGGAAPVLDAEGNFGVLELEDDTATVLALTVHALIFNVKGFFSGSPLSSMLGGLSITSLQNS